MDWAALLQAYGASGGGKGGLGDSGGRIAPVIVGTGASKIAAVMPSMGGGSSGGDLLPGISPDPVIGSSVTNVAGLRVPTEQLYLAAVVVMAVLLMRRRRQ